MAGTFQGGGGGGGLTFVESQRRPSQLIFVIFNFVQSRGMAYSAQIMTILIHTLDLARDFPCHEAASADLDK